MQTKLNLMSWSQKDKHTDMMWEIGVHQYNKVASSVFDSMNVCSACQPTVHTHTQTPSFFYVQLQLPKTIAVCCWTGIFCFPNMEKKCQANNWERKIFLIYPQFTMNRKMVFHNSLTLFNASTKTLYVILGTQRPNQQCQSTEKIWGPKY